MRVITGSARGTRLEAPEGLTTRPTAEVAKEAIFSILQFELAEASVLDLFAGSGQLGIEALSRGAKSCVFVDSSRQAQMVIRRNLEATRLTEQGRLYPVEAGNFLAGCGERFDIALLDPPYDKQLWEAVLAPLSERMNPGGIIVCESARQESLPEQAGAYQLYRTYRYGKTMVTTYRHRDFGKD